MPPCKAKSKRTGQPCGRFAMQGREVCYHHGGATPSAGPLHANYKHGRYSKALSNAPAVLEAYERHRDDPALMETLNEVALLRAKLEQYLLAKATSNEPGELALIRGFADDITRMVERRHKQVYGEQVTIRTEEYRAFVRRVLEIVKEQYGNDDRFQSFVAAVKRMHGGRDPGGDE